MTYRVLKLGIGALLVLSGVLMAGTVNPHGDCSSPIGYCLNLPLISDYPALWILPGALIAALGGTLIGRSLRREPARPLQDS